MYLYLASPYSHENPEIMQLRYRCAMDATAVLLCTQITVYSPIVHCHEIGLIRSLPKDFEFWRRHNYRMLSSAKKLLVLMLDGWENSIGVRAEIDYALIHGKPVIYAYPNEIDNGTYSHDDPML
jgi:hypothetical protein